MSNFDDKVLETAAHFVELRPHGVYRFRRWIPLRFQVAYGKREVRASLQTTDHAEAVQLAVSLSVAVDKKLSVLMTKNK